MRTVTEKYYLVQEGGWDSYTGGVLNNKVNNKPVDFQRGVGGICELKSYSSTVQNTVYVVRASPERNLGVWGSLRREVFFALGV